MKSTLRTHARAGHPHLQSVEQLSDAQTWLVAWQPEPPVGNTALRHPVSDRLGVLAGGH